MESQLWVVGSSEGANSYPYPDASRPNSATKLPGGTVLEVLGQVKYPAKDGNTWLVIKSPAKPNAFIFVTKTSMQPIDPVTFP